MFMAGENGWRSRRMFIVQTCVNRKAGIGAMVNRTKLIIFTLFRDHFRCYLCIRSKADANFVPRKYELCVCFVYECHTKYCETTFIQREFVIYCWWNQWFSRTDIERKAERQKRIANRGLYFFQFVQLFYLNGCQWIVVFVWNSIELHF